MQNKTQREQTKKTHSHRSNHRRTKITNRTPSATLNLFTVILLTVQILVICYSRPYNVTKLTRIIIISIINHQSVKNFVESGQQAFGLLNLSSETNKISSTEEYVCCNIFLNIFLKNRITGIY